MNKLNIYQIEQQYMILAEQLIANDGELTDELNEALTINHEQLEQKGRGYGFIIKDLESEVDVIDAEIKRLSAFKVSRNKTIDRLKITLSDAMQLYSIEKLESPTLKISFRKSESIEIENIDLVDKKYMVETISYTPDKKAIKDDIKQGIEVQGAVLSINQNLQIK